jgi:GT2 family glycosyltransferase
VRDDALAVVLVAHDSAAVLDPTLTALRPQLGPDDEVVVVDCASSDDPGAALHASLPSGRLVAAGGNLGFAGGANAGAERTSAPLLLLLNPDAVPEPGCLDALRAVASSHPDWAAWQALVLQEDGERINTRGGVVHWSGIAWAGGHGRPRSEAPSETAEVGFASGAALVVRRSAWDAAGGFDPAYFMYGEDVDLSLRLRLAGHGVGIAPAARVRHDYAFHKGAYKWFHLERNRAWTIAAAYPRRVLLAAAPGLLALEIALLAVAALQGWLPSKLRAQAAVLTSLRSLRARRRAVQATRTIADADFAAALRTTLDSEFLGAAARIPGVEALQAAYWRLATSWL